MVVLIFLEMVKDYILLIMNLIMFLKIVQQLFFFRHNVIYLIYHQ